MIYNEIEDIENEIREKNLDVTVSEMVEDWNETRRGNSMDPKKVEIRDFVAASLVQKPQKRAGRRFIRYSLFAAAVITGAILMIKVLSPVSPDKLFSDYYKPFKAVPEVTRGTDPSGSFSYAINSYRNGNYTEASVTFTGLLQSDPSSVRVQFFLGITGIAIGEYDKAAEHLRAVAGAAGEYSKEAKWYLGLALLKTGDPDSARENFKSLAESPGYYSEPAAGILRYLR